jgi:hypothetical protein
LLDFTDLDDRESDYVALLAKERKAISFARRRDGANGDLAAGEGALRFGAFSQAAADHREYDHEPECKP